MKFYCDLASNNFVIFEKTKHNMHYEFIVRL